MATKTKVLTTAPSPDDVVSAYNTARDMIVNKLSIPVGKLADRDFAEIRDKMKGGKNADYTASFDGEWFTFEAVIGGQKVLVSSVNVKALGDAAKVFDILKKLAAFGLASAPIDPKDVDAKKKTLSDLENGKRAANMVKDSYSKYTYASNEPAIFSNFEKWATKNNKLQFLDFLGDLTAKAAPQKIFDTYIKKGTSKSVNLSPGVASAIEKDLAAKKTPNFEPAKKEILGVVNTRMVPVFKKEVLDGMVKQNAMYDQQIAKVKQELKAMGVP